MDNEVSFEIKQDALAVIKGLSIEANFEECKAALRDMISPYKSLVVSESDIAGAKNDRAKIRKMASRIDEARKSVKKVYQEPLSAFEANCKELIAICDEGSDNLDVQIKSFEDREKQSKLSELQSFYESFGSAEGKAYCPWERLTNPKWANKGYSVDTAKEEIKQALINTVKDLETIREIGGENAAYLLDVYRNNHDLSAVIRKNTELIAAKQAEALRRQEAEARRREAEEAAKKAAEVAVKKPQPQETSFADYAEAAPIDPIVTVAFKVQCKKSQLVALGEYMKKNGISYGRAG